MAKSSKTSANESATENNLSANVGDPEVQMDRRWRKDRRNTEDCNAELVDETSADEPKFNPPRRKKQRRRQIDPTTCERDYNDEEIRFMRAMDDYKRDSGRMFPTCSEILEVVRSLGYSKLTEEEQQILESIQEVENDLEEATRRLAANHQLGVDPNGLDEIIDS